MQSDSESERHRSSIGPTSSPKRAPRILLAVAETEVRSLINHALCHCGYDITPCGDAGRLDSLLRMLLDVTDSGEARTVAFDLLICDADLLSEPIIGRVVDLRRQRLLEGLIVVRRGPQFAPAGLDSNLGADTVLSHELDAAKLRAQVRKAAPIAPVNGPDKPKPG